MSQTFNVKRKKKDADVHTKTYTQICMAALFGVAPNLQQSKFPLTDEWKNK